MKKRKIFTIILSSILFTAPLINPVYASDWKQNNVGWWFQEDNGSYPQNEWKYINNHWYWFDNRGYMVTDWQCINNNWYWFDDNGHMATSWRLIDNHWYWFESDGHMITGWKLINNNWYYFDSNGSMATDWRLINNHWYWLDNNGEMVVGWQNINNKWYYFDNSGIMTSNQWVGNYYVEDDGSMATNKWIDIYYVNKDGLWTKTKERHNWGVGKSATIRNGYACSWCYNDVTNYKDYYDCHGAWHTHTFYTFPSYYTCNDCNKLLHKHYWSYIKPQYYTGTDKIFSEGYWYCWSCGNQSSDGEKADAILISQEGGHEYGSHNHWVTPFNFETDNHDWVVEDEYWEPADNVPHLQSISIRGGYNAMSPGDTGELSVTFSPANPVEGKEVSWESSDSSIVSIDNSGKIKALKAGEVTITATSSGYKATGFIRVMDENVGKVTSGTLYINGQSNPDGILKIKKGTYDMTVATNPNKAVYEVDYKTEDFNSDKIVSNISGSSRCGNISTSSWEKGIYYTNPLSKIQFLNTGSVTVMATITDVNGDKIQLSQKVVVE